MGRSSEYHLRTIEEASREMGSGESSTEPAPIGDLEQTPKDDTWVGIIRRREVYELPVG